eukprot:scaffold90743_cov63-Phaeocystis_antarctica.AAC.1
MLWVRKAGRLACWLRRRDHEKSAKAPKRSQRNVSLFLVRFLVNWVSQPTAPSHTPAGST